VSRDRRGAARRGWDRHAAISVSLHGAAGRSTRPAPGRGGDGTGRRGRGGPRRAGADARGPRQVVRRAHAVGGAGGRAAPRTAGEVRTELVGRIDRWGTGLLWG